MTNPSSDSTSARALLSQAVSLHGHGMLEEAEPLYHQALARGQDVPEVHYGLGHIHLLRGEHAEALARFERSVELRSTFHLGLVGMGHVRFSQQHFEEAIEHYRAAVAQVPSLPEAWNNMGVACTHLDRLEQAIGAFKRAIVEHPSYLEAHDNLARALAEGASTERAIAEYEQLSRAVPLSPEVHLRLGRLYARVRRIPQARQQLIRAVSLDPSRTELLFTLGQLLVGMGRAEEALAHLGRCARLDDGYPGLQYLCGIACRLLSELDRARVHLALAVEQSPSHLPSLIALADVLFQLGESEEATALYHQAYELDDQSPVAVVAMARQHERRRELDASRDLIQPLIEAGQTTPPLVLSYAMLADDEPSRRRAVELCEEALGETTARNLRRHLHFQAGRLLDRLEEYDRAFAHYRAGNRLKPTRFDLRAECQRFDRIERAFDPGSYPGLARATVDGSRSVFVIGMPRSGTTLTEQILDRHPLVHGAGELPHLPNLARRITRNLDTTIPYPEAVHQLGPAQLDRLAREYLRLAGEGTGQARHVVDKMPHNFLNLGLIALALPGARILHCVRDWRDNCLSIFFQDFSGRHDYAYDLANLAAYYPRYQQLMHHWTQVLGIEVFEVRYAEMVADHEGLTRRMLAYLGLPWDERCISFHQSSRVVLTASHQQVREPIYLRSLQRWRHYEDHIAPLLDEDDHEDA